MFSMSILDKQKVVSGMNLKKIQKVSRRKRR